MQKKRKSRKSHCTIFKECICVMVQKIAIWSITKLPHKYFVTKPWLAMTEVKLFLQIFTRYLHYSWYFGQFFQAELHQSCDILTFVHHRFIRFKECRLFRPLQNLEMLFSHPVTQAVSWGSLSRWKFQPCSIFNGFFIPKMSPYMIPFIFFLIRISFPLPFVETQPQSIMFSAPCFTVGMVLLGCKYVLFRLQTNRVAFYTEEFYVGLI